MCTLWSYSECSVVFQDKIDSILEQKSPCGKYKLQLSTPRPKIMQFLNWGRFSGLTQIPNFALLCTSKKLAPNLLLTVVIASKTANGEVHIYLPHVGSMGLGERVSVLPPPPLSGPPPGLGHWGWGQSTATEPLQHDLEEREKER